LTMREKYGPSKAWQLSLRRSHNDPTPDDAVVIENPTSEHTADKAFCTIQIDRGRSEVELIRNQSEFMFTEGKHRVQSNSSASVLSGRMSIRELDMVSLKTWHQSVAPRNNADG